MESDIKECDEKQKTINYKICDAENRSMQENLIFYGIPEGHSKIESTKNRILIAWTLPNRNRKWRTVSWR
jgi:hypothetical protein